jgi:hypothetical protein
MLKGGDGGETIQDVKKEGGFLSTHQFCPDTQGTEKKEVGNEENNSGINAQSGPSGRL